MTNKDLAEALDLLLEAKGLYLEKPYPNEHACRLRQPNEFIKKDIRRVNCYRKSNGKCIDYIFGKLKSTKKWETQALRYPKDVWSADAARTHCDARKGSFEAAKK